MMSDELKAIVERLNRQGTMLFLEGAEEVQITSFQKKHGVSLPKKYREWLRYSDGGECFLPAGVQFYGVAHKPVIDVEEDDRPDDSYIVIGTLATGDLVLCKQSGESILVYDHEAVDVDDKVVYEDFFAFLNDLYDLLGIGE